MRHKLQKTPSLCSQRGSTRCRRKTYYTSYQIGLLTKQENPIAKLVRQLASPQLAIFYFFIFLFSAHFYFPASGQAVDTGVVPSPPRFLPSIFIAHRVQQSHCSSIVHRMLLTHALALSASKLVHKNKPHDNLYEFELGGIRTHEINQYQARG